MTHYTLNCNYGIGKPNTNGFINGGKKIELTAFAAKKKIITNCKTMVRINDSGTEPQPASFFEYR
jgi:hypothetical protein